DGLPAPLWLSVLPTVEPSQAMFLKGEETTAEPEPEKSQDQVTSWKSSSNQALQAPRSKPGPPSGGPPRTVHRSSRRLPCAASPQSPDSTAISLADQAAPEHPLFPVDGHTSSFIP
ncbi:hypothetical protein GOODEAATRI_010333, partial [Goodea atripinnis]